MAVVGSSAPSSQERRQWLRNEWGHDSAEGSGEYEELRTVDNRNNLAGRRDKWGQYGVHVTPEPIELLRRSDRPELDKS